MRTAQESTEYSARHASPGAGMLRVNDSSPASRTGVWVVLAATLMTFAAFTSAMIVRRSSGDWRHLALPSALYISTALIVASSFVLEKGRAELVSFAQGTQSRRSTPLAYLWITLGLGMLCIAGLFMAWLKVRSEGLYLATGPASAFFYLFTAVYAVHLLGGLCGLLLVIRRFSRRVPTLRMSTLKAVAYYWHGMTTLWICVLALLRVQ